MGFWIDACCDCNCCAADLGGGWLADPLTVRDVNESVHRTGGRVIGRGKTSQHLCRFCVKASCDPDENNEEKHEAAYRAANEGKP